MTDRDPRAIADHCRKAAEDDGLRPEHRQMLAGYARFYEALANQAVDEEHDRSAWREAFRRTARRRG